MVLSAVLGVSNNLKCPTAIARQWVTFIVFYFSILFLIFKCFFIFMANEIFSTKVIRHGPKLIGFSVPSNESMKKLKKEMNFSFFRFSINIIFKLSQFWMMIETWENVRFWECVIFCICVIFFSIFPATAATDAIDADTNNEWLRAARNITVWVSILRCNEFLVYNK